MPNIPVPPMAPPVVQNYAHTKLYRETKKVFKNRQIPRELFKQTIMHIKAADAHPLVNVNWNASNIRAAFSWHDSPQGGDFWMELERMIHTFPPKKQVDW